MIDIGILKQQYNSNVCKSMYKWYYCCNRFQYDNFFLPLNKGKYSFKFLIILRYNINKNNYYYKKNNYIVFKIVQFFFN